MPFNRPTVSDIQKRLISKINTTLKGADANLRFSPEGVLASVVAMASHEMHGYISWVSQQILVDTADADNLERHADIWGVARKAATKAVGRVQFTGADGAVVPAGAIVKRADDVEYTIDADITITAGTGSGLVTAINSGSDANSGIGTTVLLASPIAAIQSEASVVDDGSGNGLNAGTNLETDASLRSRVLSRIQQPPHGGASFDYVTWAREIAGVTRAWVYPQQYGIGTVGVAFVMDNKKGGIVPGASDLEAVQNHIDVMRPVTADVTVFAPTLVPVDLEIALSPNSTAVQNAVNAELNDLFLREAEPGKTILISHIREAVSLATGEFDHVVITPSANVDMNFGEMAALGNVTWGAL